MALRDAGFWKEAINDEMNFIMSNGTWKIVNLPSGSKPIGCKWVFRIKYSVDGTILSFKTPKQWHKKFDDAILANGFKHNGVDKYIYSKSCTEYIVILCLYVDDMLIFSNSMEDIIETKKYLSSVFEIKDLGEVETILGIKVKRDDKGFTLSQTYYIDKMIDKFKHLDIKETLTPYDNFKKLEENKGRVVVQLEYASVIGSLMYVAHCTRIDIAFAV
ncbi:hypothetical protein LIER_14453 [Lithospermum erythrorhizon]|uniref:Reverse transcriptase Ty1/copia-type domain-containing protein n=1 Tax=Lithospermum erythrorhizon TaxID=34254 RepID=A0AAV3PZN0_LITER